jgi:hypothetical protein
MSRVGSFVETAGMTVSRTCTPARAVRWSCVQRVTGVQAAGDTVGPGARWQPNATAQNVVTAKIACRASLSKLPCERRLNTTLSVGNCAARPISHGCSRTCRAYKRRDPCYLKVDGETVPPHLFTGETAPQRRV